MEHLVYYASCVIVILIGIWLIKRFVGCLLRSVVSVIVIAILLYVYFAYLA